MDKTEEKSLKTEEVKDDDKYLRLAAEFENYKKRTIKEKQEIVNETKIRMLTSILDIDNDISIALNSLPKEQTEGLNLILKKLESFLKTMGIEEIQTDEYDKDIHEVISMVPSDDPGKIISVVSKGYSINGKPFRYPKIVLSKNK